MDTTPKPTLIPGLRTLAKDMARRQGQNPAATSKDGGEIVRKAPEASFVENAGAAYRAPVAKKNSFKAAPTKKEGSDDQVAKAGASNIKPLAGPKSGSEPTIIVDNEDAASATIIRDTKRNRFRLFPAINAALVNWVAEIKERYFTKKAPKYTVPETTRRKGLIQAATSKTGKVATFDNTSLQDRIRARRERSVPKSPTTTWSANTEPGFLLLEQPQVGVTNVQVVPRKSFRAPTPAPAKAAPVVSVPPAKPKEVPPPAPVKPVPVPTIKTEPAEPRTPWVVTFPAPEITQPEVQPEVVTEVLEPSIVPLPTIEEAEEERSDEIPKDVVQDNTKREETASVAQVTKLTPSSFKEWLFALNTNTASMGIALIILTCVITLGAGFFWIKNSVTEIKVITVPNHPTLLAAPLQIVAPSELSRKSLVETITENQRQSGFPILQFALAPTTAGNTLFPPATILAALETGAVSAFTRSVETLYFGSLNQTTPFIVLKVTDPVTAWGGMLAWENRLYADLLPLLTGSSQVSLDGRPATAFTDTTIAENDARVLKDVNGREILVYSLTEENLLIITTTSEAVIELFNVIP